jgi:FlaA1/EpsC-like NDP-sugar epimerase
MWRYAGIRDLINIVKGTVCGTFIFIIYLVLLYHFIGFSRGVILINMLMTIIGIGGSRLIIRLYYQKDSAFVDELVFWRRSIRNRKNILILGTSP